MCGWELETFMNTLLKNTEQTGIFYSPSSPSSSFPPKQKGNKSYPFTLAFLCFCSYLFPGTTFSVYPSLPVKTQLSDGKP